jgi:Zn-dependent protease
MLLTQLFTNPFGIIIFLVVLLTTISVHEFAHAKVADELGDPTPRLMGRVTLNPRAHIDPWGLVLLFLIGFGWGKPVPFDPFNLKNPRRDAALISIAGPLSNVIMAITGAILLRLLPLVIQTFTETIGYEIVSTFIYFNIVLGIFNLLPFAPLDGFKIVGGVLPEDQAREWYSMERYGIFFLIFFILPFAGGKSMLDIFVHPVVGFLYKLLVV